MRYSLATIIAYLVYFVRVDGFRPWGQLHQGVAIQNIQSHNEETNIKQSYIIGGEIADSGLAPWQVSIQNEYGNHFCGGAIVSNQYILTAASCVTGLQKKKVKVISSTNNLKSGASHYDVEDILTHCNFDKPLYHNDIALIKLKTDIVNDELTQPIILAEENDLIENEQLTMTGWGSWALGEIYPEELKKLDLFYVPLEKCKIFYRNSSDVDDGHLCAISKDGEGVCHGDTGGPLINSRGQLVGISNFGVPCAAGFPDVFAKIPFYYDWIRSKIKGCQFQS